MSYLLSPRRVSRRRRFAENRSSRYKPLTQIRAHVGERRQIGINSRRFERNNKEESHRRRYARGRATGRRGCLDRFLTQRQNKIDGDRFLT